MDIMAIWRLDLDLGLSAPSLLILVWKLIVAAYIMPSFPKRFWLCSPCSGHLLAIPLHILLVGQRAW